MCGGGPKGPSAEELVKQKEADKAAAEAETAKIEAERQLEKDKEAAKLNADNKAMAEASAKARERQLTLLSGVNALAEEDDDKKVTLPDGTPADFLDETKPKRKKRASTLLAE